MEIEIQRASAYGAPVIEALLDAYLRELSLHREHPVGATCAAEHRYLPLYWSEPGRLPFTIHSRKQVVGFALVRGLESTSSTRWELSEFYVEPGSRRRGVGRAAAAALWRLLPGAWELQVHILNIPAVRFWSGCIEAVTGAPAEGKEIVAKDGRRLEFSFTAPHAA